MRAWKLVLYSRVLAPSPLSCIRFFTRSRGCTKTVAPILGEDRGGVKGQVSQIYRCPMEPGNKGHKGQGLPCNCLNIQEVGGHVYKSPRVSRAMGLKSPIVEEESFNESAPCSSNGVVKK